MFEYNGRSYNDGADYSRLVMKGFLNHFEKTEDGIFYLIKGLEMILHELENKEYIDNKEERDYEQGHRINKLRHSIDQLKGVS